MGITEGHVHNRTYTEINNIHSKVSAFIQQGCIELLKKSDSKVISKIYVLHKCYSFEVCFIHQRILGKM